MQQLTAHVPAPQITVDAEGTPRSIGFDDVYFSARHGVAETQHVYLAGNSLPGRWQDRAQFTIGELGFGTGLNFLVAWNNFRATSRGHLHFLSVEKFPLTLPQLKEALAHQPELANEAAQLIANYPLRLPGWHRVQFDNVTLTLGFGDVSEMLPQMDAAVEAWFLDGFAPAKNDAMWNADVFQQIARLSAADATFATFTAAGVAKRGLQEVGFMVQKVAGFGHKRDMLVGIYNGAALPCVAEGEPPREGGQRPQGAKGVVRPPSRAVARTVTIIGGGIAGCSVARALAERGLNVTLHERDTIASGASGNAAAVMYPQLTKYYTPATAWHFAAYDFAQRAFVRWGARLHHSGMLRIGKNDEDDIKLRSIRDSLQLDESVAQWLEPDEASARVEQKLKYGGFYFPHGAWLNPADACRALLQHPNITVHEHSVVSEIPQADAVIIANAYAANDLLPTQLTMGLTAGQVSVLAPAAKLSTVLCHAGYAIDAGDALIIGATYDRTDVSGAVTQANHEQNIADLRDALPIADVHVQSGRTSFRATTPSRLPHVGKIRDGLYVSVGHGSRGMISAPLAAELIASEICGEPLPVSRALRDALAPR